LADTISLDAMEGDRGVAIAAIIPPARLLTGLPSVVLTPEGARHARHGRDLGPADLARPGELSGATPSATPSPAGCEADAWFRLLDADGELLGLARPSSASGLLHPSVVLM